MTGHGPIDEYSRLRRTVGARDQAYVDVSCRLLPSFSFAACTLTRRTGAQSVATTQALRHACTAIQSAHHHYSKSMDLLDAVCSPKRSKWESIMGDEQSRQETYRGASLLPLASFPFLTNASAV